MSMAQAREIWRFIDGTANGPILVHCVAGLSRSTAVAAGIIVRGLMDSGMPPDQVPAETVERLLAIRPPACPNGLVLKLMLQHFLPDADAVRIATAIWEDDRIMHNRFVRIH